MTKLKFKFKNTNFFSYFLIPLNIETSFKQAGAATKVSLYEFVSVHPKSLSSATYIPIAYFKAIRYLKRCMDGMLFPPLSICFAIIYLFYYNSATYHKHPITDSGVETAHDTEDPACLFYP